MSGALEQPQRVEASYVARFRFLEAPFLQVPDARFVYRSESHARVLERVVQRINLGDRLVVVAGDEGSGKTTLCMELSQGFPGRTDVSIALDPEISRKDLLHRLFIDFGLVSHPTVEPIGNLLERCDDDAAFRSLLQALAQEEKQAVLVMDDAHDLDLNVWERLFAAWTADENEGRLQMVLVGQPRIEEWLRQVDAPGRAAICPERLAPLCDREVEEYIERRLWVARGGVAGLQMPLSSGQRPHLSDGALEAIVKASQGNPRLVNAICDRALTRASERSSNHVDRRLVKRVAVDLRLPGASGTSGGWTSRWTVTGALGLGLAAGLFAAASLHQKELKATATESARARTIQNPTSDQTFEAFRKVTLQLAASLAAVPDVKGLLNVRDEVLEWQRQSNDENDEAIKDLLTELEHITNQARARRLALDHHQFLEDAKAR